MTVTVTHAFVSSVTDDPSVPQEVRPSNWNADHVVSGANLIVTDGVNSVTDVTQITVTGATVSGSSPDATLTISGGGGGAWVKVSSGSISTPVEYFDVALPSGYLKFLLEIARIAISGAGDVLAAAFSYNGGSTFFCDTTNHNTYASVALFNTIIAGPTPSAGVTQINASLMQFLFDNGTGGPSTTEGLVATSLSFQIDPGSTSSFASILSSAAQTVVYSPNQEWNALEFDAAGFKLDATVAPTNGIVNLIRFVPGGNGDIDPPTSGETFTQGNWVLLGLPT